MGHNITPERGQSQGESSQHKAAFSLSLRGALNEVKGDEAISWKIKSQKFLPFELSFCFFIFDF